MLGDDELSSMEEEREERIQQRNLQYVYHSKHVLTQLCLVEKMTTTGAMVSGCGYYSVLVSGCGYYSVLVSGCGYYSVLVCSFPLSMWIGVLP